MRRWLVFGGKTGWIGQKLVALLEKEGEVVQVASSRLEDRAGVEQEIDGFRPTHILNAAGSRHVPIIGNSNLSRPLLAALPPMLVK